MMKLVLLLLLSSTASAFAPTTRTTAASSTALFGYVPSGMSPEEYQKLRAKEQANEAKKKYGAFGPQSFQSRSLQAFQKDLEQGKAGHLMPVFNAKEKLKKGELKQTDIPYMQRMGSWDNSDIKTATKKQWSKDDKQYKQNASQGGWDWTGSNQRTGPAANKQAAAKAPPKKKGLFGW